MVLTHGFKHFHTNRGTKQFVKPRSFTYSNTIGGNAHENWTQLRLLPLLIGHILPEDEPVLQLILEFKDIVELVVAPVHTDKTIA